MYIIIHVNHFIVVHLNKNTFDTTIYADINLNPKSLNWQILKMTICVETNENCENTNYNETIDYLLTIYYLLKVFRNYLILHSYKFEKKLLPTPLLKNVLSKMSNFNTLF